MVTAELMSDTRATELARECVYRFLAAALSDPRGPRFRLALEAPAQRLACEAADLLRAEAGAPGRLALGELPAEALALNAACAHLRGPLAAVLADYDRAFGLAAARECPPYETEFDPNAEPFYRAQQMADVAGFYRAFGLTPSPDMPERPDHVALELEFLAFVLLKKRQALAAAGEDPEAAEHVSVCEQAEHSFFRDHLAWWVPAFAAGLRRHGGAGFYTAVGRVLAALIPVERGRLGVDTPSVPARPSPGPPAEESDGCAGCAGRG